MLGFEKPVQEAIDAPYVVPTFGQRVDSPSVSIAIPDGAYPDALIEDARRMGTDIQVLPVKVARRTKGAAAAITVDSETGLREGGSVRRFSLGY
jgi:hypothetical protein